MRHFIETTGAMGLSFCMAALAWAQNAAPPAAPPGDRGPAAVQPAIQGREDRILANCLVIDNEGEVKLARFAKDRAQSPEVKKFADMMIQDHTQFINQLHPFLGAHHAPAAAPGSNLPNRTNPAPRTDAPPPTNSPIAAPAPAGHEQHFDHLALKRELADQCFKSMTAELEKKQGREFDHCYMAAQVMLHEHMKDTLTVFSRHASPNLQATLKEGLQTTDRHLTEAKRIFETLKDSAETARRPVELPRGR